MTPLPVSYAHSLPGQSSADWHPLAAHLTAVAEKAREFAHPFGADDWAHLAGLWHDLGKYSVDFQTYLQASTEASAETQPGRVDHSTAGAQHATRQRPGPPGKALAFALAGHHAGLPDAIGTDSSLASRLDKTVPNWSAAPDELACPPYDLCLPLAKPSDEAERGMRASLFIRMLFSALVDADFLDTEAFMDPGRAAQRPDYPAIAALQERLQGFLQALRARSEATPVNAARRSVLDGCLNAAALKPGLFSLTVPTGGGKTLSSLAFALKHACQHGLRRVIYAVPFTSIIEQNADVFRSALGAEAVLEHHSNIDPTHETASGRLASENWDAPLVVTTNVQFFESFFASRTSSSRKLHNVAGSVVILDEAQALPVQLLHPCLALLRELVASYGCTVVLCTATQPAIEWREEFPIGLPSPRPIIENPLGLFQILKRVDIDQRGSLSDDDLISHLRGHDRVLCIVNTRRHAAVLFDRLGRDEGNLHLSALMCPAHRAAQFAEIRSRLLAGETCRVISTQLVEAGVDLDFPVVYRASAGLDSVAQAAGRCNREGHLSAGHVVLFEPEAPIPAGHLRHAAQAASEITSMAGDLLSPEAIETYFRLFYWQRQQDWDAKAIMRRLIDAAPKLSFPFRSIANDFRFICDGMEPIVIPWDAVARSAIAPLRYAPVPPAGADRRLQRYIVSVPKRIRDQFETHLEVLHDRFFVLANMDLYDDQTGLRLDDASSAWDPEALIA